MIVQFGRFQLDSRSQLLYKDGEELPLEPKLIEVLQYLLDHRDRYVSLTELHNAVWVGRIVTDTAVRRTISKLRTALEDDVNEPVYIKSLPKRGYRLIAELVEQEYSANSTSDSSTSASTDEASSTVNFLDNVEQIAPAESNTPSSHSARSAPKPVNSAIMPLLRKSNAVAVLFLLALGAVFIYRIIIFKSHPKDTQADLVQSVEVIDSLPSEKLSLAISDDGKYLAYSARTDVHQSHQLFIQNLHSSETKQITHGEDYIGAIEFILGNKAIAYTAINKSSTELRIARLDRDTQDESHVVGKNFFTITNLEEDDNPGYLYAAIFKDSNTSTIYKLNLNTGETQEASFSDRADTIDIFIATTPLGTKYSFVRGTLLENNLSIYVFDKHTDALLKKINWQPLILDFQWLDENRCLILDKDKLSILDVNTLDQTVLLENSFELYTHIKVLSPDQFLILRDKPAEKFEVQVNLDDFNDRTELPLGELVLSSSFHFSPNKRFWVQQEAMGYSLYEYDIETASSTLLLNSDQNIHIFDLDPQRQALLLSLNGRLGVFYRPTQEIKYITNQSQFVEDARFYKEGEGILYGEKQVSGWRIRFFDLLANKSTLFLDGFRSIRAYNDAFIAAKDDGELYLISGDLLNVEDLGIRISFEFVMSWNLIDDYLIWSQIKGEDTVITVRDLNTGNTTQLSDIVSLMNPTLFFDLHAKTFSYRSKRLNYTDVLKVTLRPQQP